MKLTVAVRHHDSRLAITVRVLPQGIEEHRQLLNHCSRHRTADSAVPAAAMRQWRQHCRSGEVDAALALQQPVVVLWDQLALEPQADGTASWHGLIADGLISRALVERLRWGVISTVDQLMALLQMLELEDQLSHGPVDSDGLCGCLTESDHACSAVPWPAVGLPEHDRVDHPA